MRSPFIASCLALIVFSSGPAAADPAATGGVEMALPSRPGVGSPELAYAGPYAVGVKTLQWVDPAALDPMASVAAGHVVKTERSLPITVWYPAKAGGTQAPYTAELTSEPPRPPARFHIPAMAVKDAAALGGGYPIVVVSHGYNNDPVMLSWLTENLASKGYVVVGISHYDPPITDRTQLPAAVLRRPLDIAFVLRSIRAGRLDDLGLGKIGDVRRIAQIGYSMGAYGSLVVAGATLDPASPLLGSLPKDLVARYAAGGPDAKMLSGGDLKAVIPIAPAGGAPWNAFGEGIARITAPLMIIAAENDRKVGYEKGPVALFRAATGADRWLLVFKNAGHSLGVDPAPAEMHGNLWDYDWFEDPVWRKERLNAVSLHFITALLDWKLKGDASRAAYLKLSTEDSKDLVWKGPDTPWDAVSDGLSNPFWKGFVRDHADGLIFRHLPPGPAATEAR